MKVLVVHNRYRSNVPSGENMVVNDEIDLLRSRGLQVSTMLEESDSIDRPLKIARAGLGPLYSHQGVRRFQQKLAKEQPDVVHLHNVFPLVSPWVVRVANKAGVPVLQTVHNYRHGCINGLHFRDGHVCVECIGTRLQLPGTAHGCYRGSRLQSAPMTASQVVHRSTWRQGVSRFFALTPFMRDKLLAVGIPEAKIIVRPTWVPDRPSHRLTGRHLLFVGRLDENKGVRLMLEAWRRDRPPDRKLRIIGDGPLRGLVEGYAAELAEVDYLGPKTPEQVFSAMDDAACIVVPSTGFEGYPLVIAEAFRAGRPVMAVRGGSAATVVESDCGWVADPTSGSLSAAMREITQEECVRLGRVARRKYIQHNSPEAGFMSLLSAYESVAH